MLTSDKINEKTRELNMEYSNLQKIKRPRETTQQDNIKIEDFLDQTKTLEQLMVSKLRCMPI